jgi:putative redox protein
MKDRKATLHYAGNDFFIGVTPSGHSVPIDVEGTRSEAPGPTELLLLGLGSCTGADVISVLRKKREKVTDYRIEVRSERREEHPRSFKRIEVKHIVRGHGISAEAVAKAIDLSANKYCGVISTVRPTAEVVTAFEIQEEPEEGAAL